MRKRPRPADSEDAGRCAKRTCPNAPDLLSPLSDELLLRALSYLPIHSLARCQRLSHRFHALAGDSQLWKAAYYNRFVRPRAARIPGIRDESAPPGNLFYSSRLSKWLDDERLVRRGKETNWKEKYRLGHNWSRGLCDVSEIEVAERPPVPPLLVRLHEGVVITADASAGLRAWSMKGEPRLIATSTFRDGSITEDDQGLPTSLAVNSSKAAKDTNTVEVAVGFEDGRFGIYRLETDDGRFTHRFTHAHTTNGMITALAFSSPYLLTMTEVQRLSLYHLGPCDDGPDDDFISLRRLLGLKSNTVWPPLSLSLRSTSRNIIASIAYAIPTYLAGWSVGLQELHITPDGDLVDSRLASAVNQGFTPLSPAPASPSSTPRPIDSPSSGLGGGVGTKRSITKPTSLSYSHPYLLASHPDNTLTLYLVTSSERELSIGSGSRLWGHTSSVSGAHVGGRGKAVSVSSRGDELRVWELEGGLTSAASRRRLAAGHMSVQVRADPWRPRSASALDEPSRAKPGLSSLLDFDHDETAVTKGWVDFDDETVVLLREQQEGRQTLVVYDFT